MTLTHMATELIYDFVSILLVEVAKFKMPSNWKISVTSYHHSLFIHERKTTENMKVSGFCYELHFHC